jgi:phage tail sheath protein FI
VHDFFRQGGGFAIVAGAVDELVRAGALFNLLVVLGEPPAEVTAAAVALAEERGALCILEPPAAWSTVAQAVAGASAPSFLRSPNAVMYFPRIAGPGPLRGSAGAVAGVFARSDVLRGVWAAPAGVEAALRWVEDLSVPVSDAENGRLNPLGVNCLRNFAGAGPVVWGARTTADESDGEWKYVNVRRMAMFLEQSLSRGLEWAVFEPNDEPLWGRIRAEAGAFLDDLSHRGAFAGTTPRESYFVKCDRDTTGQDDIDHGAVNVVVGFAPARPGEFVNVTIRLVAPPQQ